ncbi:aspartate aminotransferase family protein [Aurantiacibacter xanthus]|uniref:Aspartate aminotransferase family protein n=1 Tax=Aurantiacibacter xanthus TaxID=1784712 RepID=A0A3A1P3H7_9SPHN|nr:aspartate aminotransferase family protein [Aurantiacibacter xanthus]RIV82615.1 aspartate aminotransferase family protein [Aurantiacibacter xanthus]
MQNEITDSELLQARRDAVLSPSYRLFYEHPIHVVRGEGVWLHDAQGRKYLDAYNNVPVAGHCHPYIVERTVEQARKLNTHTRYLTDKPVELAERLLATMPSDMGSVILTNSGSEANDLAIRIARMLTGGTGVIVTDCAYHGTTDLLQGMSPVTGLPTGRDVFTIQVPLEMQDEQEFGRLVRECLDRMQAQGVKPAALLVDTIFGSDGAISDPAGFLKPALEEIHAAGAMFIADEVQPGFGRTGGGMWGFSRHGIVPDFVTMGKPMGNGHPVAALVTKRSIAEAFRSHQRYFNTFGGNTVSSAAALATLDVIEQEGLVQNARETGAYLRLGLEALARDHDSITALRGSGLFQGVQTPSGEVAARIVNAMRDKGVLIGAAGRGNAALKVRPPLPVKRSEVDFLLDVLAQVLRSEAGR